MSPYNLFFEGYFAGILTVTVTFAVFIYWLDLRKQLKKRVD